MPAPPGPARGHLQPAPAPFAIRFPGVQSAEPAIPRDELGSRGSRRRVSIRAPAGRHGNPGGGRAPRDGQPPPACSRLPTPHPSCSPRERRCGRRRGRSQGARRGWAWARAPGRAGEAVRAAAAAQPRAAWRLARGRGDVTRRRWDEVAGIKAGAAGAACAPAGRVSRGVCVPRARTLRCGSAVPPGRARTGVPVRPGAAGACSPTAPDPQPARKAPAQALGVRPSSVLPTVRPPVRLSRGQTRNGRRTAGG